MSKTNNDVLAELLSSFKNSKSNFEKIKNDDEKKLEFLKLCNEVLEKKTPSIATNLQNLINHYLFTVGINVEDFVMSISNEQVLLESFFYHTGQREKKDSFDTKYNTFTEIVVEQFEMGELISPNRYINAARYHPSPVNTVRIALDSLIKYGVNYSDFVFIDIGSGMGRNLLIASEYPFQSISGVEISRYLHEIAENNIIKYKAKTKRKVQFNLHCIDALSFTFSNSNMVLYFWEPFSEVISNQFVKNLETFLHGKDIEVKLIFLRNPFPALFDSKVFNEIDHLKSPDFTISNDDYFQIVIFSN